MTSSCTPVTLRPPYPTRSMSAGANLVARFDHWATAARLGSRSLLERFLGQAVDHADLADRMRRWHAAEDQGGWFGSAR